MAAISDIRTGGTFVDSVHHSSGPVHVVMSPVVVRFLTARRHAFVAQHFLNTRGRLLHLKHTTSVDQRTLPEKMESFDCKTKGRNDAFYHQRQC